MKIQLPTGNPQKRTNQSFLDSALGNVAEAAQRLAEARRLYHSLPPGDPRLIGDKHNPGVRQEVLRALADEQHWRREVAFWRGRCVDEGEEAVPELRWTPPKAGRRPDPLRDPALAEDPIVRGELAARAQRQLELDQLARAAARERVPGGDDDDLAF